MFLVLLVMFRAAGTVDLFVCVFPLKRHGSAFLSVENTVCCATDCDNIA